jgi:hypothetical protein
MADVKQFAITFFNLKLWKEDKGHNSTRTESWLEGRFRLFEKYCLPSMQKQTLQDFIWLCLFDKDTPEKYLKKIQKYKECSRQFTPVFLSEEQANDKEHSLHQAVQQYLNGDEKFIITTNVDNDDAIRCDMLKRVRETIESQIQKDISAATGLYNCIYGLQYFVSNGMIIRMMYPHNHFQTLCETPENFKTIKGFPHTSVRKMFVNHDITDNGKPYWMEIVHEHNVNNGYRVDIRLKNIPIFKSIDLKDFGQDLQFSAMKNSMNSLFVMPCLFAAAAFRGILRHLTK